MKAAFLILAHRNFAQVQRLIQRLLLSDGGIVLHVDARVSIPKTFRDFCSNYPGRIFFPPQRFATYWGSFEAVEATLEVCKEGVRSIPTAKYFSLLSGQDYPLKSPQQIDTFFQQEDRDFIQSSPLAQEKWQYGSFRRLNRFYWAKNRKSLLGFVFRTIPLPPRRVPLPKEALFWGSNWWTLRKQSVAKVLEFTENNPEVLNAFKYGYVPDELFFQTVLSGYLKAGGIANNNVRYIEHFGLPRDYLRLKILNRNGIKDLTIDDLPKLLSSPALFARKFDAAKDSRILDALDEQVHLVPSGR